MGASLLSNPVFWSVVVITLLIFLLSARLAARISKNNKRKDKQVGIKSTTPRSKRVRPKAMRWRLMHCSVLKALRRE